MKGDKFFLLWLFAAIGFAGFASDSGADVWKGLLLAACALGAMFMAARSAM